MYHVIRIKDNRSTDRQFKDASLALESMVMDAVMGWQSPSITVTLWRWEDNKEEALFSFLPRVIAPLRI